MMSLPRRLSLSPEGRLLQAPILPEGLSLLKAKYSYTGTQRLPLRAAVFDLRLRLRATGPAGIKLREGEGEETLIRWDGTQLSLDRGGSGLPFSPLFSPLFSLPSPEKEISLRIIVDLYSVELFIEGRVISALIFPKESSQGISLWSEGPAQAELELKVWPV